MNRPLAVFLMGPTASGKTGLAVELVERMPLEIISVDSAMVYRGMDIGTAKPDAGLLRRAPHRLIDIRDPSEPYSAAEFRNDAMREMQAIAARGNIPLLVGGTMLYFRALEHGLSELPAADPAIRAQLAAQARQQGWAALHQRLQAVDPAAAARIHPNDPQRIQRALEVYELTGTPLTVLCEQGRESAPAYRFVKTVLAPADRGVLHERIEHRLQLMVAQGFLDEVRRLRERRELNPELPSMRAVGYRQAWAHLAGELSSAEWQERTVFATRQYAKRQLTWLRGEAGSHRIDPTDADAVIQASELIDRDGAAAI